MTDRMHFIGVSTTGSRIMDLFPRWAGVLGLDARIVGRDVPIGADPVAYRREVETIAEDDRVRGALVTTHKVQVFRHAADLFGELGEWASLCREVSCISKRDGSLQGEAKDPVTSWRAMVDILGSDYWTSRGSAEVLCMGAGGSGTAITSRLLTEERPPARIIVTNRSKEPLRELREVHEEIGPRTEVRYQSVSSSGESDALLEKLAPGSLVVNATGMGKDRPGSPISDGARFPEEGVAWELNYRGELGFLKQALRQREDRRLRVHDGWGYFLHGWSEHMAEVFGLDLDRGRFEQLAEAAEPYRPPS